MVYFINSNENKNKRIKQNVPSNIKLLDIKLLVLLSPNSESGIITKIHIGFRKMW